jgi:hypothetical protein
VDNFFTPALKATLQVCQKPENFGQAFHGPVIAHSFLHIKSAEQPIVAILRQGRRQAQNLVVRCKKSFDCPGKLRHFDKAPDGTTRCSGSGVRGEFSNQDAAFWLMNLCLRAAARGGWLFTDVA